jgi:hypothetical protein
MASIFSIPTVSISPPYDIDDEALKWYYLVNWHILGVHFSSRVDHTFLATCLVLWLGGELYEIIFVICVLPSILEHASKKHATLCVQQGFDWFHDVWSQFYHTFLCYKGCKFGSWICFL